jgi:predicted enzyme related to lactoylglutathione lyase
MQKPLAPLDPITAVLVHVPDIAAGLAWYGKAFRDSTLKTITQPQPLHYLDIGGVMLEMVPADDKVTHAAAGSVVYWRTPNFAATLAHFLSVGATLYRGPLDVELGQRMCQVRDPWGNCIGIKGPIGKDPEDAAEAGLQRGNLG